jgi:hypothetical protein
MRGSGSPVARCDSGGQRTRVALHGLPLPVDSPPGVYGSTVALTCEDKAIGRQLALTEGDEARLDIINELLDASPES